MLGNQSIKGIKVMGESARGKTSNCLKSPKCLKTCSKCPKSRSNCLKCLLFRRQYIRLGEEPQETPCDK